MTYDEIFSGDSDGERLKHYLLLQEYTVPYTQLLPALDFYNRWVWKERKEAALAEGLLILMQNWSEWGRDFILALFNNFHILSGEFREKVLMGPMSKELYQDLLAEIDRGKARLCQFHYPPEADSYEDVVDGYEFRLLRNSDEYLTYMRSCALSMKSYYAPVLDGDGMLHFGIFEQGKRVACLELHSVFEIFYDVHRTQESCLHDARIRIAVLHWLKKHGLDSRYGPYFPEDYAYLSEEAEENGNK